MSFFKHGGLFNRHDWHLVNLDDQLHRACMTPGCGRVEIDVGCHDTYEWVELGEKRRRALAKAKRDQEAFKLVRAVRVT